VSTLRASLLVLLAGGMIAGCDQGEAGGASASTPTPAEPLVGVADDGSPIIFAGRRDTPPPATTPPPETANLRREPNAPDPERGDFTLEEAVVGLPIDGTLVAEIGTDLGTLLCDLHADRAPRAVANFIGLARGIRPWWDARAGEWVRRPYYRGLTFHRVIPGYLAQGGDYLGDGTGTVGYTLPDELHDSLSHDRAGQLCMANQGDAPNSAGAQFFITDGPAPQLDRDGRYTIFGQCIPEEVVSQIARVPQNPDQGNRPLTPVRITRLLIRRVVGGAAAAEPTRPQLPPGEPEQPRGASEGPTVLRSRDGRPYPEPSPLPGGRRSPPRPPIPGGGHDGHNH
jgi:peptidyl-prolyl cis-trans isomerase A (cyclophilin A)